MSEYQFSLFSILPFSTALYAAVLCVLAWRRRTEPGSSLLAWLMFAVMVWSLAFGLQTASIKSSQTIVWSKIAFVGIQSIAPIFTFLVRDYPPKKQIVHPRKLGLVWIIPLISIYLVFTNENHGWIWQAFAPNPTSETQILFIYAFWYWISTAYAFLLVLIGTYYFIRRAIQLAKNDRSQAIILLLASLIPWVAIIFYLLQIAPINIQALLPLVFVIAGTLFGWGMLRNRLFNITRTSHRKFVESMPDAVIMVDNQNKIGYLNPSAQAIIHIPTKVALGNLAHTVLTHWPFLEQLFRSGNQSRTEIKIIPSISGQVYDCRISRLEGRGNYHEGHLIVLRDITARRELENDLKAREELYRTVTTQANDGIAIVQDDLVIYCNPHLADLIGYAIEDIIFNSFAEFIAPNEVENVQDRHLRRMKGEEISSHYRTALLHKSGDTIPVEFSFSSIKVNDQPCILIMARDIGNTLKVEAEIHRLASVVEQADESIVITDLSGDIVYVNPQFEKTSGYTFDEVLGENSRILKSDRQNPGFYKHLWDTITSGNTWEGTFINKNKSGQVYYESATLFPIKNQQELITHYAAVKRDITEQIMAEKSLRAYARQKKLINELTQTTIEPLEFQQMLDALAKQLGALISSDGCVITIWDAKTQKGYIGGRHGFGAQNTQANFSCPECLSFTKMSLDEDQPIIIDDINQSTFFTLGEGIELEARAVLVLPLSVDKKDLGAAILIFEHVHTFSDAELRICQQASQQVALAIYKAHLLETAERRAEEAETLHLAGRAVTASLHLDDAIEHILNELNRVVPHDSASVQLIKDQEIEIVGQRGFPKDNSPIGIKFSIATDSPNAVVVSLREPYILEDAPLKYAAFREPPHNHIRGWMGVPLLIRDRIIGLLALDSKNSGQFTESHARLANAFASQVAIALENARLYEETHKLAITDTLTESFTRHHFLTLSDREYQRAYRYQRPLSLIMMDLDNFKMINDTYGHPVGDRVLKKITKLCKDNLRESDIIGRYGGEEFTILLPETPGGAQHIEFDDEALPSALTVSERLRYAIETTPINTPDQEINITVSIGIAELSEHSENITTLIQQADDALYQAKRGGRNQVVVWTPQNGL
ncbi:MAG: diguanylate cyclase [Anaerolineae bacterium]|nr:diguanylate cyclase [Anaerolineae bacterium]